MQISTQPSASQGNLNTQLIDRLKEYGNICSLEVEKVMKSIDRGEFSQYNPYDDQYAIKYPTLFH